MPVDERVSGPDGSPVMAAFPHPSPAGSRFADASSGAYYAAKTMDTAIAETPYHQARLLALTSSASTDILLDVYLAGLDVRVHDVRGTRRKRPALYTPSSTDYGPTQAFAATLRATGSDELAYDSVRYPPDGQCVALFRSAAVQLPVRQRDEGPSVGTALRG